MKDDKDQSSWEVRQLTLIGTSMGKVDYGLLCLDHASHMLSLL